MPSLPGNFEEFRACVRNVCPAQGTRADLRLRILDIPEPQVSLSTPRRSDKYESVQAGLTFLCDRLAASRTALTDPFGLIRARLCHTSPKRAVEPVFNSLRQRAVQVFYRDFWNWPNAAAFERL